MFYGKMGHPVLWIDDMEMDNCPDSECTLVLRVSPPGSNRETWHMKLNITTCTGGRVGMHLKMDTVWFKDWNMKHRKDKGQIHI